MKIKLLNLFLSIFLIGLLFSCKDDDAPTVTDPGTPTDSIPITPGVEVLKGPERVARWTFDNKNLLLVGENGINLMLSGKHMPVEGPNAKNNAIEMRTGSSYAAKHGIAPNGGGQLVNEYSIMFDVLSSNNEWKVLYNANNSSNGGWGQSYIRKNDGALGVGSNYSDFTLAKGEWYRLVVTVNLPQKKIDYYADGKLVYSLPFASDANLIDGEFSLSEDILFFYDTHGSDGTIRVADLAMWDRALTAAEIDEIGGYVHVVAERDDLGRISRWTFDNKDDLLAATLGQKLVLNGSHLAVVGAKANDGAVEISSGSNYLAELTSLGIKPNGGGEKINKYTLMFDLSFPTDEWKALFNTDEKNGGWGQSYIRANDGAIGEGSDYSGPLLKKDEWYRIVISADLPNKNIEYYVDGVLVHRLYLTGNLVDGGYSLKDKMLFFADNGGSDGTVKVSEIGIWDKALTLDEITKLGGFNHFGAGRDDKGRIGRWTFDNASNLLASSIGNSLELIGTHRVVAGPAADNGAVEIGIGSHYDLKHTIVRNGGGKYINEYSFMFDVSFDNDGWKSLFQTGIENSNDGDFFIADNGTLGVGETGYSSYVLSKNQWYRVIAVFKLGDAGKVRYYVDGKQVLDGNKQVLDGRFALEKSILLFADENGDDYPIKVAEVGVWDYALSDAEVEAMGGYGHQVP